MKHYSWKMSMLLCLCGGAYGQPWSGVLSTVRGYDWQHNAGIVGGGGIPSASWAQCGATIAPYGSSGTPGSPTTINNALNHTGTGYTGCASNTYIKLGAGTFYLNAGILVRGVSGTVLRGSGSAQTKLVFSGGSTCQSGNTQCAIGFEDQNGEYAGGISSAAQVTSGLSQGSTSITVTSGSGIVANQTLVVLDQCNTGLSGYTTGSGSSGTCATGSAIDNGNFFQCNAAYNASNRQGCSYNGPDGNVGRWNREQEETHLVTACSPSCGNSGSTTLTLSEPLAYPNWSTSQSPEIWLIQASRNVGVEDLAVEASGTTLGQVVGFNNLYNCWAKGVAALDGYSQGIAMYNVAHCDLESNYVYNSGQNVGDPNSHDPSSYDFTGSYNLIANNISQKCRVAFIANGPSSANVIAYNLAVNEWEYGGYMWGAIWDGHSNGNSYNLYEGNVADQVFEDQTHGGKLMQTFYRNFLTGWESCANGQCGSSTQKNANVGAVLNLSYNRYGNWIGNLLGTPNISTAGYTIANAAGGNGYSSATGYIYFTGSGNTCAPSTCAGGPIPVDPVVATTSMFWGNWDAYHSATQWNSAEVPSGISVYPNSVPTTTCSSSAGCPASFYLGTTPTWWASSIPFPAMGPDVTGGDVSQCTGTPNAAGHYALLPAISSTQCVGTSIQAAWAGHINAIPAMAYYLNGLNGPPDGTGAALTFDGTQYYQQQSGGGVNPPSSLQLTVQ